MRSRLRVAAALAVVALTGAMAFAAAPAAAADGMFGNPNGTGCLPGFPEDLLVGTEFTLGETGQLLTFHMQAAGGEADQAFRGVVYSIDSPGVGTLVATSTEIVVPAGSSPTWHVATLPGALLPPGQYVIGFIGGPAGGAAPCLDIDAGTIYFGGGSYPTPPSTIAGAFGDFATLAVYVRYTVFDRQGPPRRGYCLNGSFLDLLKDQPTSDAAYAGATPALYVDGKGITCDAPPAGFAYAGLYQGPDADTGHLPLLQEAQLAGPLEPGPRRGPGCSTGGQREVGVAGIEPATSRV